MKSKTPFVYQVSDKMSRGLYSRNVLAWKSRCPGLILQSPMETELSLSGVDDFLSDVESRFVHIVHKNSSCILLTFVDFYDARLICGALSGLPIDWECKTAQEVYLQVAKVDTTARKLLAAICSFDEKRLDPERSAEMARNHEKRMEEWRKGAPKGAP